MGCFHSTPDNGCGYWSGADGCDSIWDGGFFYGDRTHFLLIKSVLRYAEYFKQNIPEMVFIVGSNFRNEHLLGSPSFMGFVAFPR